MLWSRGGEFPAAGLELATLPAPVGGGLCSPTGMRCWTTPGIVPSIRSLRSRALLAKCDIQSTFLASFPFTRGFCLLGSNLGPVSGFGSSAARSTSDALAGSLGFGVYFDGSLVIAARWPKDQTRRDIQRDLTFLEFFPILVARFTSGELFRDKEAFTKGPVGGRSLDAWVTALYISVSLTQLLRAGENHRVSSSEARPFIGLGTRVLRHCSNSFRVVEPSPIRAHLFEIQLLQGRCDAHFIELGNGPWIREYSGV
uniref:Uncharacterized protein n=1 Tax=Sphaerodactylus townsendi TaxID=933632 RepID=A0ACB8F8B7_9SAUR